MFFLKAPGFIKNMNKPLLVGLIALLLLLAAGGLYGAFFSEDLETIDPSAYTVIQEDQFASTIKVQGTVDTSKDVEVYTSQTAPVQDIYVEENDVVTEGQVLAVLDDGNLRDQIAIKEAATGVSGRSAAAQVQAAENRYQAAQRALAQGTNAALVSADTNVHVAQKNWESAEKAYQDFVQSLDQGYHPELAGQDTSSDGTQASVRNSQTTYDQAKAEVDRNHENLAQARQDMVTYDGERQRLRQNLTQLQTDLAQAQRTLAEEQAKQGTYDGLVAQRDQARASLDAARDQLRRAEASMISPPDPAVQEQVLAYRSQVQSLQANLDAAEDILSRTSPGDVSGAGARVDELTAQVTDLNYDLTEAESNYAKAEANAEAYDKAQAGLEQSLDQSRINLENILTQSRRNRTNADRTQANLQDQAASLRQSADAARQAYDDAQRARTAAQASAQDEVQSLQDAVATTAAAGDNSAAIVELGTLYRNLEEMTIRAPISGVVTQIQAQVGMIPTGPMFKIESTNDLLIETELKEIDVNAVKEGMRVEVRTDATGDQVFTGRVVSIAPVSSQHANQGTGSTFGSTDDSGQPTFKTVIAIHGNPTQLKAGMEARLTIILSEDDSALAVPYASVYENEDGQTAVLVARPSQGRGENRHEIKEVVVETGLENDLAIVVTGNLYEGDKVLLSPGDFVQGQEIFISTEMDLDNS